MFLYQAFHKVATTNMPLVFSSNLAIIQVEVEEDRPKAQIMELIKVDTLMIIVLEIRVSQKVTQ